MQPAELLSHFKTQTAIAQALGIEQPSVSIWFSSGRIPELRQLQIEALTGGALKADKGILPAKKTKRMYSSAHKVSA